MQLTFLPEIDREATRKNVESAMDHYRVMLLMDPEEFEPKITASFNLAPGSNTNAFSSTTESVAVQKVDLTERSRNYTNKVRKAVNRLNFQERSVIIKRYLEDDDVFDYEVYNELGFSESKYYKIKSDAFYKLAFILKIAVYKEVDVDECCSTN